MSEEPTDNRIITPTAANAGQVSAGEDSLAVAHQALAVICLDPSIRKWLAASDPKALEQADTARVKLRDALDRQAAQQDARDGLLAGAEPTVNDTVTVRFVPQAWIRDTAIRVDPVGATTFEVPAADAKDTDGNWLPDHDYPSDRLREHANAPDWIREWSGPFEVEIHPKSVRSTVATGDRR